MTELSHAVKYKKRIVLLQPKIAIDLPNYLKELETTFVTIEYDNTGLAQAASKLQELGINGFSYTFSYSFFFRVPLTQ